MEVFWNIPAIQKILLSINLDPPSSKKGFKEQVTGGRYQWTCPGRDGHFLFFYNLQIASFQYNNQRNQGILKLFRCFSQKTELQKWHDICSNFPTNIPSHAIPSLSGDSRTQPNLFITYCMRDWRVASSEKTLAVSLTFFTESFKLLYDLKPQTFQSITQESLWDKWQNVENCHWVARREKVISHSKLIKHSYCSATI